MNTYSISAYTMRFDCFFFPLWYKVHQKKTNDNIEKIFYIGLQYNQIPQGLLGVRKCCLWVLGLPRY